MNHDLLIVANSRERVTQLVHSLLVQTLRAAKVPLGRDWQAPGLNVEVGKALIRGWVIRIKHNLTGIRKLLASIKKLP